MCINGQSLLSNLLQIKPNMCFFNLRHSVMEHGIHPIFYSDFPLFLLFLLSPLEAFLAFAQSKRSSQHLTMCALLSFFLMPIRCPSILVVYWLL
jgi:hypothetical protein